MAEPDPADHPALSILVAATAAHAHAESCLQRLADACAGLSCEWIVVRDGEGVLTQGSAPASAVPRWIGHAQARGVAASWNEAAGLSRGEGLLFLTADVHATRTALRELVGFAIDDPRLDAVAPHTLDGNAQDRPMGVGFASPQRLATLLARLSPSGEAGLRRAELPVMGDECLLVAADAFRTLEGFDAGLGPRAALFDLALRLLARGRRVGHHPASLFVHAGARVADDATLADIAALRRRWGVTLATSPDALWTDGRDGLASPADVTGSPGHFCDDPARLPPPNVSVGHATYFVSDTRFLSWTAEERVRIGRYCSFARGVTIFAGGDHSTDTVSTFPFEARMFGSTHPTRSSRASRDTEIGHDVWVGDGATIGGGVHIGDGAVIATGAVVLSDVPPYAIAAGNPARVLRHRFSRATVEALQRIRWWDWDEDVIRERLEWFFKPLPEFIARFDTPEVQDAGADRAA